MYSNRGVAFVVLRSISQRADALIAIAHPAFREQLTAEARSLDYL
jgi:acyl-CoA hydrolase